MRMVQEWCWHFQNLEGVAALSAMVLMRTTGHFLLAIGGALAAAAVRALTG